MTDIAQIGFRVDTGDIRRAGKELANFEKRTQVAGDAIKKFESKGSVIGNVINNFEKGFKRIGSVFEDAISGFFNRGKNFFDGLKDGFKDLVKNIGRDLLNNNILQPLKKNFSSLLSSVFSGSSNNGGGILSTITKGISSLFGSSGSSGGIFSSITKGIGSLFGGSGGSGGIPSTITNGIGSLFGGSSDEIFSTIKKGVGSLFGGGGSASGILSSLGSIGTIAAVALPLIEPIKNFFKSRKKRSELSFDTIDGVFGTRSISTKGGGSAAAVTGIFNPVTDFISKVLEQEEAVLLNRLQGRILFKRKKAGFVNVNGVEARVKQGDTDSAAGFILREFFQQGQFDGLSESIRTASRNAGQSFKEQVEAIQFAQVYDSVVDGTAFAPAKSQIEKSIDAVKKQFADLFERTARFGLDTSNLLEAEQREIGKIRTKFVENIEDGILKVTNTPLLQFQNLLDAQSKRSNDAGLLNLNPSELAKLEQLSLLERRELLRKFSTESQQELLNLVDTSELFATKQAIVSANISNAIDGQIASSQSLADSLRSGSVKVKEFADGLSLSNLSPLSNTARLNEARQRFNNLVGSANAGDAQSLGLLPQAAQQILGLSKLVNASNNIFQNDFKNIEQALALTGDNALNRADVLDKEVELLGRIQTSLDSLDQSDLLQKQVDLLANINTGINTNVIGIASGTNNSDRQNLVSLLEQFIVANSSNNGGRDLDNLLAVVQESNDIDQAGLQQVSNGIDDLVLEIQSLKNENVSTQELLQQVVSSIA